MVIILNEKSLDGQFANLEAFLETLPEMNRCLELIREGKLILKKHSMLFQRRVTETETLHDLQNRGLRIHAVDRDKVRKWKILLASLTNDPPFWDTEDGKERAECYWRDEDVSGTSLAEAARLDTFVLSFEHSDFHNLALRVTRDGEEKEVKSCATASYLAEGLYQRREIDIFLRLKAGYQTGRISMDFLDTRTGSVGDLQKKEIEELIQALEHFDAAESWDSIGKDRFFNYKAYQPASKADDWFAGTAFSGKDIVKFRCGKHSRLRCFGYREKDRFYVLRVERDHKISDNG